MRLIDADALLEWVEKSKKESTAGVESEWASLPEGEEEYIGVEEIVYCPVCGTRQIRSPHGIVIPMLRWFSYCPCCGAKMNKR